MKKVISMLLSAAMVVTLAAGCSQKAAAPDVSKPQSTVTEESKKEVTISYMTWDYADRKSSTDSFINSLKDKFNIKIELLNYPTDQYQAVAKTRLAANDVPDLINAHRILRDMTLYGYKLGVDTFADISSLPAISEYLPEVVNARKINGKLYYMPVASNALGAIYNKKVFKDLGLAIPQNIDDFTAALDKIKAAGIIPIGGGFKDAWITQIIPFIAVGQYVMSKDDKALEKLWNGTTKWSSPEFKKAIQLQLDFAHKGYFLENYLGSDVSVAGGMVANGKAAMLIVGNWQYGAIKGANKDAEIGFFPVPLNAKGEQIAMCTNADGGICINAASKNLKETKDALNFYLGKANQTIVINDLKGNPTNKGVTVEDPFAKEIQDAMSKTKVLPNWLVTDYKISSITVDPSKEFQAMLGNSQTVDKYCATMDSEIEKALKK